MQDPVRALIASVLQLDPGRLADTDGADTVPAWDSLKTLMLASMIEVEHGLTLDNADIEQLTSVAGVRAVLARHGAG